MGTISPWGVSGEKLRGVGDGMSNRWHELWEISFTFEQSLDFRKNQLTFTLPPSLNPPMITDIKISETSYRGRTEWTVSWLESGSKFKDSFNTKEEANLHVQALEKRNTVNQPPPQWVQGTQTLLKQLESTPEELNEFLTDLARRSSSTFKQWRSYIAHSIDMRQKIAKIATSQAMDLGEFVEAIAYFEEHKMSEVLEVYESTAKDKSRVREMLATFVDSKRAGEEDEDEILYVERKLERVLEVFGSRIAKAGPDEIAEFVGKEPGSANAKKRFLELIEEFRAFVDSKSEVAG